MTRHFHLQNGGISIKTDQVYAGVWLRFAALVIDIILLSAVFFPVTRIVKGTWMMSSSDHQWAIGWFVSDPLCLVFFVVMVLYFVFLEGFAGGTLGKLLLKMRVVDIAGARAGVSRSLLRNVLRVVDSLPTLGILGAILISTSPDKARFGDRIAGTRVVRIF